MTAKEHTTRSALKTTTYEPVGYTPDAARQAYKDGKSPGSYAPRLTLVLNNGRILLEDKAIPLWYTGEPSVGECHSAVIEWRLSETTDLAALEKDLADSTSELRGLLDRVYRGGSVEWDDGVFVGRLDADAREAAVRVGEWVMSHG